jgi:hypothetical protein
MTITINSKECPLHFGVRALKTFTEGIGTDLKTGTILHTDQLAHLVYAGIENAAYAESGRSNTCPVTFKEVYLEIESISLNKDRVDELTAIYNAFAASETVKSMTEKPDKKKASPKRSIGKR